MKIITKNIFVFFLIILYGLTSCDDYLDRMPLSGPSDENYFNNEDELTLVVNGLYSSLVFHPTDDMPLNLTIDAASDIGWDRNTSPLQALGRGDHDSNNGYVVNIWTNSYKTIGKCNFILDNIDKLQEQIDAEVLERYRSEARFIRAYVYQYLIDYFGGVPLMSTGVELAEANVPKSPREDVAQFVLDELAAAAESLPLAYGADDIGRATKGAALAIRARAALNNGFWDEAAASAKAVMDLGIYELHPNYGELFSYAGESSTEIIFAYQYLRLQDTKTHSTTRNYLSRNAQGTSNKVPSQSLIDSYQAIDGSAIDRSQFYDPEHPFDNRDPRLAFTVALPGSEYFGFQFETHKDSTKCWNYSYGTSIPARIDNQDALNAYATFSGYCWRKYVDFADKDYTTQSELNIIQSRYAEVLLIYAEAMIEAGNIDQSVYDAINAVRQRPSVEMPPISSGRSQQELREIIRMERLFELAGEGFRVVDLRRWEIADEFMNSTLYGRVPKGLLSDAPRIEPSGYVDYGSVGNRSSMRVIENRKFNSGRDYLWPIPNIEIVTNPNLEQNPGY